MAANPQTAQTAQTAQPAQTNPQTAQMNQARQQFAAVAPQNPPPSNLQAMASDSTVRNVNLTTDPQVQHHEDQQHTKAKMAQKEALESAPGFTPMDTLFKQAAPHESEFFDKALVNLKSYMVPIPKYVGFGLTLAVVGAFMGIVGIFYHQLVWTTHQPILGAGCVAMFIGAMIGRQLHARNKMCSKKYSDRGRKKNACEKNEHCTDLDPQYNRQRLKQQIDAENTKKGRKKMTAEQRIIVQGHPHGGLCQPPPRGHVLSFFRMVVLLGSLGAGVVLSAVGASEDRVSEATFTELESKMGKGGGDATEKEREKQAERVLYFTYVTGGFSCGYLSMVLFS